jgi:predicted GTPase
MTEATSAEGSLSGQVQAYLNGVVGAFHRCDRADLVDRLRAATEARREQKPTVVIVGETGRGKSSLVNSLLQQPGIDPVGLEIATACAMVFRWASAPGALVRLAADGSMHPVEIDQLGDWATTDGNPQNERGVHAVIVGLDNPLLAELTLVDTPGSGGLDGGHATLAFEAAQAADALLFVIDAGAPISDPEIRFLERVAERIDDITVVMTKVDQSRGWSTLVDDARKTIRDRVPRLAETPILAVSNTVATRGDRKASGLPELEEQLRTHIGTRVDALRYANIIRLSTSGLDEVMGTQAARRVYLTDGEGALAALQADRSRMEALRADPRAILQELDKGLRRFSLDRSDTLNRAIRQLRLEYDDKSLTAKAEELEALPATLLADVTALSDRLADETGTKIADLVSRLIGTVDDAVPELASLTQLRTPELAQGVALSAPTRRTATRLERMSTMISFSSGRSIGSLVASLPLFALGGLPFMVAGLGVGGAFAWQMHRGRSEVVRQNEFRTWMREQLAEVERQLNNDFSRAMIDVTDEARAGLTERIEDRKRQVEAAIKDCEAALRQERSAQAAELSQVEAAINGLQSLRMAGLDLRSAVLAPVAVGQDSAYA